MHQQLQGKYTGNINHCFTITDNPQLLKWIKRLCIIHFPIHITACWQRYNLLSAPLKRSNYSHWTSAEAFVPTDTTVARLIPSNCNGHSLSNDRISSVFLCLIIFSQMGFKRSTKSRRFEIRPWRGIFYWNQPNCPTKRGQVAARAVFITIWLTYLASLASFMRWLFHQVACTPASRNERDSARACTVYITLCQDFCWYIYIYTKCDIPDSGTGTCT